MILGIGIDLVELSNRRFGAERLARRILGGGAYCRGRKDGS